MSYADTQESWFEKTRRSNGLAVFIVYVSLMIDAMLLTAVAPILPEYLSENEEMLSFFRGAKEPSSLAPRTNASDSNTDASPLAPSNQTNGTLQAGCAGKWDKELLAAENLFLAFILASKPLVQLMANIAVGPLCDRFGYDFPMLAGYIIIIVSSIIFAFGTSYVVLFMARALQGIGSACMATAGMAKIAARYPDDTERGRALGLALGGLGLGVLIGPSFASVAYHFWGMKTPFLILSGFTTLIAILQLCTMQRNAIGHVEQKDLKSAVTKLLKDRYILLAALTLFAGNFGVGVIEAGLPMWMMSTLCAEKWMLGVAFLPMDLSYLAGTAVFSRLSTGPTRWFICLVSFFVAALGYVTMALCRNLPQIIGPGLLIGLAIGMVDSTIFPIVGHWVDIRHNVSAYGSVYAILDAAFCTCFVIGPLVTGVIVSKVGFWWMMVMVSIALVAYAPFVAFLRNPPHVRDEEVSILHARD